MRYLKNGLVCTAVAVVFAILATFAPGAVASPSAGTASSGVVASSAGAGLVAQTQNAKLGSIKSVVRGTFGEAGRVTGSFHPSRFVADHGKVFGVGQLSAKLIRGNGTVLGHVNKHVALPLRPNGKGQAGKFCRILDLILGPLHLNLLGLHVDLNKVILHITAFAGAGQLLGNLLCAVAHLLDGTHITHAVKISNLLNRILGLLRV